MAIYFLSLQDPNRIAEWRANGALSPENALSVRTTAEMLRCSNDSYPASPGVITDKVWFGTTSYSLYGDNDVKGYFSLTYRGYRLTNMTGAEWQVGVGKALSPNKTDLAVMLLTEADYLTWNNDCANRTCSPPFTLAIANTTCQGLKCTGSASGLKGDDAYRLVVAYPEVCGITNAACYSMDMPSKIGSPFAKELVSVVVTPKDWALAPPDNKAGKSVEVAEVVAAGTPGGEDSPLLAAGLVGLTGTLGSP